MEYGEYLRFCRKERNLYQNDVAEALICSVQAVSKYEAGKIEIGLESVDRIAKLFKISVKDFFSKNINADTYIETLEFSSHRLSTYLIYLRKKQKITQKYLGEQLHIAYKKISKWETEASLPSLDELLVVAQYYDIDIRDLYYANIEDGELDILKRRKRK